MSEYAKTLLSVGGGFIAGLLADPIRRYSESKQWIWKATKRLHGSTRVQFWLLTQLYGYLDQTLKELPALPKDEQGNSGGPAAQAILDDDQYRILGIEHMCSDFNTDIYESYYGDKHRYYDIPHAEAITVLFEYLARLSIVGKAQIAH